LILILLPLFLFFLELRRSNQPEKTLRARSPGAQRGKKKKVPGRTKRKKKKQKKSAPEQDREEKVGGGNEEDSDDAEWFMAKIRSQALNRPLPKCVKQSAAMLRAKADGEEEIFHVCWKNSSFQGLKEYHYLTRNELLKPHEADESAHEQMGRFLDFVEARAFLGDHGFVAIDDERPQFVEIQVASILPLAPPAL